MIEIVGQPVELLFPVQPVPLDPGRGLAHRPSDEPAAPHAPVAAPADEPGALEHPQMLGNRGQAHGEWPRQFSDGRFAGGEARDDRAAGRVGERGERGVER